MTVEELTNPPVDTNTTADEFVSITPDGQLKKRILRQGSGASPVAGSKVRVHYVGTLHPSGEKFDSSRDRNDMFEFNLGKGQVIRGWDEGVATMKVGELAELLCPPEYAYGEHGSPPRIPGGATLKFEVELFDFDEPADTTPKKLELAMNAKAAGNDAFKTSEFQKAVADYQKGLKYLDDIYDLTEAEQAEKLRPLQQSLYLNLAACQLKLKDAKDAALNCHKALELDQNNVKAMFRLGQAYAMLGEFEKASVELKRAKELAPGDISIQKELVAVHKSQEAYRQKERNMFSKMFS